MLILVRVYFRLREIQILWSGEKDGPGYRDSLCCSGDFLLTQEKPNISPVMDQKNGALIPAAFAHDITLNHRTLTDEV